jgi:hypothetical protein
MYSMDQPNILDTSNIQNISDASLTDMSSQISDLPKKKFNTMMYIGLAVILLIIIGAIIYIIVRQQSIKPKIVVTSNITPELSPQTTSNTASSDASATNNNSSQSSAATTDNTVNSGTNSATLSDTPPSDTPPSDTPPSDTSQSNTLSSTNTSESTTSSNTIVIPEESLVHNFVSTGINNVKCSLIPNCTLTQGTGDRNVLNNVLYTSQLKNGSPLPMIMLGISLFDSDKNKSKECNVVAQNMNNIGFGLNTQISGSTFMYGLSTSWLAISNKFAGLIQSKIINVDCNPIKNKNSVNNAPFSLTFDKPFAGTPLIFMAFTKIDTENSKNQKIFISNIQSSPTGVTGTVSRWDKSQVYGASVACIAVDPISSVSMTNQLYKLYNVQTGISNNVLTNSSLAKNNADIGTRSFVTDILFVVPYTTIPSVSVALTGMSTSNKSNERINIYADNITPTGFKLNIQTWSNSYVGKANVSWMAYA